MICSSQKHFPIDSLSGFHNPIVNFLQDIKTRKVLTKILFHRVLHEQNRNSQRHNLDQFMTKSTRSISNWPKFYSKAVGMQMEIER